MFQINVSIVFRIAANTANENSNQWCYLSMSGSNPVLAIPSATPTTITIPDGIIWKIMQAGAAAAVGFQMSQSTTGNAGQTYYLNCDTNLGSIELVTDNTETGTAWCCAHTVPGAGNGCFIFGLTQNGSSRFMAGSVSGETGSLSALAYPLPVWPSSAVWSWGLAVKVSITSNSIISNPSITFDPPIIRGQYEFLNGSSTGFIVFFMDPKNTNSPTPWTFSTFSTNGPTTNSTMVQSFNVDNSVTVVQFDFTGGGGVIDFNVIATNGSAIVIVDPQVSNTGQSSGGGY